MGFNQGAKKGFSVTACYEIQHFHVKKIAKTKYQRQIKYYEDTTINRIVVYTKFIFCTYQGGKKCFRVAACCKRCSRMQINHFMFKFKCIYKTRTFLEYGMLLDPVRLRNYLHEVHKSFHVTSFLSPNQFVFPKKSILMFIARRPLNKFRFIY